MARLPRKYTDPSYGNCEYARIFQSWKRRFCNWDFSFDGSWGVDEETIGELLGNDDTEPVFYLSECGSLMGVYTLDAAGRVKLRPDLFAVAEEPVAEWPGRPAGRG